MPAPLNPTSLACSPPTQLEREFEELDVDHDGFITAEDLVAASRSAPSNNRTNNAAGERTGNRETDGLAVALAAYRQQLLASSKVHAMLHHTCCPPPPDAHCGCGACLSAAAAAAASGVAGAEGEDSMSAALHKVVHEVLGDELTLTEAKQMLAEVDASHNGKISLSEVRREERTADRGGWQREAVPAGNSCVCVCVLNRGRLCLGGAAVPSTAAQSGRASSQHSVCTEGLTGTDNPPGSCCAVLCCVVRCSSLKW